MMFDIFKRGGKPGKAAIAMERAEAQVEQDNSVPGEATWAIIPYQYFGIRSPQLGLYFSINFESPYYIRQRSISPPGSIQRTLDPLAVRERGRLPSRTSPTGNSVNCNKELSKIIIIIFIRIIIVDHLDPQPVAGSRGRCSR